MRQPPEVVAEMNPYYAIMAVSLIPALVFQVFRQFAEALGKPLLPMAVMLGDLLLNVLLNWILIYGKLGAPALGLAGAGIATLAARVAALAAIIVILKKSPQLRPAWPRDWLERPAAKPLREFLSIGLPSAAMLVFETGAFAAVTFFMGWFGAHALAAQQIAITCVSFAYTVPLGISMAAGMRISKNLAAGNRRNLRPIGFGAIAMSAAFMSLAIPVFALAGKPLAQLFSADPLVVSLAAKLFVIAALFQVFDATQVTANGSLRGLLDVKIPTLVTFVAYWLIAIPAGLLLAFPLQLGPVGLWVALALALCFAAILLTLRFHRLTRRLV
jgi:MATE family multidrug resistance protein